MRTCEVVLLASCANTGDLHRLVVENGCTDESGNEGGEHLTTEGDPRRNVGVMSEFEILGEVEGVQGSHVSIEFEVDHRSGVTGIPETTEQLGDDVESDLYIGNCHDDTTGNAEDHGEEHAIQRCGGGGVGGISSDSGCTKTDGNTQDDEVDPLRDLCVRPHQADVDIPGVGEGRFTSNQVLAAGNDLAAVVQSGVNDKCSVCRKEGAVDDANTGGQTGRPTSTKPDCNGEGDVLDRGIGLVSRLIE